MTTREPRIDIIRGFSILIILINHLTQVVEFGKLSGWMIPTPTRYGYSTAAELFVIMSGYMVGLVYLQRPRPIRAIWRRAGKLWTYNLALFALILPLAMFMLREDRVFWHLQGYVSAPATATLRFLTFQDAPRLLDILQTYMKLMLVAPVAILLHKRSPAWTIALSVGLYAAAEIWTFRHLAASPTATSNDVAGLLTWQMLFFVPMALGAMRVHVPLFRWLEGNWAMLALFLLLFTVGAAAKEAQMDGLLAQPEWLDGRYGLQPLRVAHAVLVLLLYASALTVAGRALQRWPFRAIGGVGRHSLDCFGAGVFATYVLGTLWQRTGGGYPEYYLFAAIGVAFTVALAFWLEARKARRTRDRGVQRELRPQLSGA